MMTTTTTSVMSHWDKYRKSLQIQNIVAHGKQLNKSPWVSEWTARLREGGTRTKKKKKEIWVQTIKWTKIETIWEAGRANMETSFTHTHTDPQICKRGLHPMHACCSTSGFCYWVTTWVMSGLLSASRISTSDNPINIETLLLP